MFFDAWKSIHLRFICEILTDFNHYYTCITNAQPVGICFDLASMFIRELDNYYKVLLKLKEKISEPVKKNKWYICKRFILKVILNISNKL